MSCNMTQMLGQWHRLVLSRAAVFAVSLFWRRRCWRNYGYRRRLHIGIEPDGGIVSAIGSALEQGHAGAWRPVQLDPLLIQCIPEPCAKLVQVLGLTDGDRTQFGSHGPGLHPGRVTKVAPENLSPRQNPVRPDKGRGRKE